MDSVSIIIYSIIFLLILGIRLGLFLLFRKAGKAGWEAFVPIYSDVVWLRIVGRPMWWLILTLIPVARTLIKISMDIDLVRAFGKYGFWEQVQAVILPFYYFIRLGVDKETKYLGPPAEHKKVPRKSSGREWADAILYAGVAALLIRSFMIEAFMIPTSSMERTLMAGDFLFVSKFHYGTRMPMVPLSIPFVHNKISIGGTTIPSYLSWPQLPYFRFPGLRKIRHNDIVVFNYPAHDIQDLGDGAGLVKPVSMKENYIKRCVGLPGDTLEVVDQQVMINGKPGENPEFMQLQYQVETDGSGFSNKRLHSLGFRPVASRSHMVDNYNVVNLYSNVYQFFMPDSIAKIVGKFGNVTALEIIQGKKGDFQKGVYPHKFNEHGELFHHNIDNFGPVVLPHRGMTVDLTPKNLSEYWRVIDVYEDHDIEIKGNSVFIDGQESKTYTFEMDYYWMQGDNRHNSQDSRIWGFVPEDHIVGRPLFIFFSYEKEFGLRLDRIGTRYTH